MKHRRTTVRLITVCLSVALLASDPARGGQFSVTGSIVSSDPDHGTVRIYARAANTKLGETVSNPDGTYTLRFCEAERVTLVYLGNAKLQGTDLSRISGKVEHTITMNLLTHDEWDRLPASERASVASTNVRILERSLAVGIPREKLLRHYTVSLRRYEQGLRTNKSPILVDALAGIPPVLQRLHSDTRLMSGPDKKHFAIASNGKFELFRLDGESRAKRVFSTELPKDGSWRILGLSGPNRLLASDPRIGCFAEFAVENLNKPIRVIREQIPADENVLTTDSQLKLALTANTDGLLRIVDLEGGRTKWSVETEPTVMTAGAIAPDQRWLAVGSMDGRVEVWDSQSGKRVMAERIPVGFVNSLVFSDDSEDLLLGAGLTGQGYVAMYGGGVGAWNKRLWTRERLESGVAEVKFLGPAVAVKPFAQGPVRLYDAATGEVRWTKTDQIEQFEFLRTMPRRLLFRKSETEFDLKAVDSFIK